LNDLAKLAPVTIVDLDQRHAIETAYVRAATGLKLPDAAIIATARLAGAAALIGNDRQWRNKPLGVAYHHMDDILALA
jgi:PIN domain nuclease of toxin-antitoxin system